MHIKVLLRPEKEQVRQLILCFLAHTAYCISFAKKWINKYWWQKVDTKVGYAYSSNLFDAIEDVSHIWTKNVTVMYYVCMFVYSVEDSGKEADCQRHAFEKRF